MLVTLFGIVTLVRPLQPKNAPNPMLVTGYPPSVAGTVTAPVGSGDMAALAPLTITAVSSSMLYVHV